MDYEVNSDGAALAAQETDAVIEVGGKLISTDSGEPRQIPLNRLHLSEYNVRKLRDPDTIPALAATIMAAGGLLNPLAVVPGKKKGAKGEQFGVIAGGRRLAALQWLVKQGALKADAEVSCRVFDVESATSISLTENASQEAMHPADQLIAFKTLVEQGRTVGQIAAAFGVSELTVERRLKLASLAPVFIDLYRENKIEQKQLMALALSDDHAEQLRVWEALPSYSRSAYHIEQMLTHEEVSADAALAMFVGMDAYKEAGGSVRTDLFAEAGGRYLQDGDLLHRLAVERLEDVAQTYRGAGWKWVETRLNFPHSDRSRFGRVYAGQRQPTKEEAAAMRQIEADLDAITKRLEALEAMDGDYSPELEAEAEELESQYSAHEHILADMETALREWHDEQMAVAGVVVFIGHAGGLEVVEGLVKAEDRKAVAAVAASGDTTPGELSYSPAPQGRAEYSAALCQNMTAHRTAAVSAALMQSPRTALELLLVSLIVQDGAPWVSSPIQFRFSDNTHQIAQNASGYGDTPAAVEIERGMDRVGRLSGSAAALLPQLRGMDESGLLELLAVFVGRSYAAFSSEPVRSVHVGDDLQQQFESALEIDMADWWAPDAERFLSHVSKAKMAEAVTQACGADVAAPLATMKKADAVAAAAGALEGKRWLPSTLRAYVVPELVNEAPESQDASEVASDD